MLGARRWTFPNVATLVEAARRPGGRQRACTEHPLIEQAQPC